MNSVSPSKFAAFLQTAKTASPKLASPRLLSVCLAVALASSQASAQTASLLRIRGMNRGESIKTDHLVETDITTTLAGTKANALRMLITYDASYGAFTTEWPLIRAYVVKKVQWCQAAGIKAVLCIDFSPWDDQGIHYNTQAMWQRSDLSSEYCALWTDLVNDMAPYRSTVWAYDLINEPNYESYNVTPPQWRQLAIDEVQAIHAIDPLAWCVYDVGPLVTSATLVPMPVTRVIYNTHFYRPGPFCNEDLSVTTPGVGTHRYPGTDSSYVASFGNATANKTNMMAYLQNIRNFQTQYNVPIYMGEFSVSAGAQLPDSANWLADVVSVVEGWGWNWTYHGFKEAKEWDLFQFDTQRKASVLAGLANNVPPDTDTVASAVPIMFETENLTVLASSDTARIITSGQFSNGEGTILDANAVGDYVTYNVPGLIAGSYDLRIGVKDTNTRGIWQNAVAPAGSTTFSNHGVPYDEYTPGDVFTEVDLGTLNLGSSGDKQFRFTVTGKNASSSGYTIAFDYIKLIPQ